MKHTYVKILLSKYILTFLLVQSLSLFDWFSMIMICDYIYTVLFVGSWTTTPHPLSSGTTRSGGAWFSTHWVPRPSPICNRRGCDLYSLKKLGILSCVDKVTSIQIFHMPGIL